MFLHYLRVLNLQKGDDFTFIWRWGIIPEIIKNDLAINTNYSLTFWGPYESEKIKDNNNNKSTSKKDSSSTTNKKTKGVTETNENWSHMYIYIYIYIFNSSLFVIADPSIYITLCN